MRHAHATCLAAGPRGPPGDCTFRRAIVQKYRDMEHGESCRVTLTYFYANNVYPLKWGSKTLRPENNKKHLPQNGQIP